MTHSCRSDLYEWVIHIEVIGALLICVIYMNDSHSYHTYQGSHISIRHQSLTSSHIKSWYVWLICVIYMNVCIALSMCSCIYVCSIWMTHSCVLPYRYVDIYVWYIWMTHYVHIYHINMCVICNTHIYMNMSIRHIARMLSVIECFLSYICITHMYTNMSIRQHARMRHSCVHT